MAKIKTSIVIPNYNGRKILEKNLPAVLKACQSWAKVGWEIVVVDDGSTDDSLTFLKENYPQIRLVVHQKNQRFAAACNSGFQRARGGIIVLLNSDVAPEAGFLKPLLARFKEEKVFAVGCKERSRKNGKVIWSGRGIMRFKRGLMVHWRAKDQNAKTTDWVTAGSGAYDREKWLKLGGMDTLFRPAYEEDRDLSWRAKKKGWKNLFEPQSIVNHQHETTHLEVFGWAKIKIFSFKNQFLFVWKNGDIRMLLIHLFWLPYHLLVTGWRTRGLLLIGFSLALIQLPETLAKRIKN